MLQTIGGELICYFITCPGIVNKVPIFEFIAAVSIENWIDIWDEDSLTELMANKYRND